MIYIATYHRAMRTREQNVGCALQSYALQKTLENMGYDSRLILMQGEKRKMPWKIRAKNLWRNRNVLQLRRRDENFQRFFEAYHKTTELYKDFEDLKNNPPTDGMYLSGSDQVFRPDAMNPMFFLQFGPKEIKRVSYAASMGVSDIPPEKQELFQKYISVFDSISLREFDGKDTVERLYGKPVSVHVDPTLLLDKEDWAPLQSDRITKKLKKPYILVYSLYRPDNINEILAKVKAETGCDIVVMRVGNGKPIRCDRLVLDAGPGEFLDLIANARLVLSSSFHGAVFSIIYRKPFYALVNPGLPSRHSALLKRFALQDRIYNPENPVSLEIDYSKTDALIRAEQEAARAYLQEVAAEP